MPTNKQALTERWWAQRKSAFARVSKDGYGLQPVASWFETREAALLTMMVT